MHDLDWPRPYTPKVKKTISDAGIASFRPKPKNRTKGLEQYELFLQQDVQDGLNQKLKHNNVLIVSIYSLSSKEHSLLNDRTQQHWHEFCIDRIRGISLYGSAEAEEEETMQAVDNV